MLRGGARPQRPPPPPLGYATETTKHYDVAFLYGIYVANGRLLTNHQQTIYSSMTNPRLKKTCFSKNELLSAITNWVHTTQLIKSIALPCCI